MLGHASDNGRHTDVDQAWKGGETLQRKVEKRERNRSTRNRTLRNGVKKRANGKSNSSRHTS